MLFGIKNIIIMARGYYKKTGKPFIPPSRKGKHHKVKNTSNLKWSKERKRKQAEKMMGNEYAKGKNLGEKNPTKNPKVRKKISDKMKGNKNSLGVILSKGFKKRLSKRRTGEGNPMFGHKQSETQKKQARERHSGERNSQWKGGITPLAARIRHCFKYCLWRSDIFTRDDFTCQKCGLRGGYLEADHYPKRFSKILEEYNIKTLEEALVCEELWNRNNGRTLCKKCHDKTKRRNPNFIKI